MYIFVPLLSLRLQVLCSWCAYAKKKNISRIVEKVALVQNTSQSSRSSFHFCQIFTQVSNVKCIMLWHHDTNNKTSGLQCQNEML